MFPLKDENPTEITPVVTVALIAVNVLVWLLLQGAGQGDRFLEWLCVYGAIPADVTGSLAPGSLIPLGEAAECRVGALGSWSVLTSMFMHGGWMHLIGNMWFLWVFGNNIEDSMGHLRFAAFYLLTGIAASAAHILTDPSSAVPTVGASGAISGVMGAYIVLYPRVRVLTFVIFFYFIRVIALPAAAVLGLWFVIQLASGAMSGGEPGGGVAFWAHVGGFVAGVALVKLFERRDLVRARRERRPLGPPALPPRDRW